MKEITDLIMFIVRKLVVMGLMFGFFKLLDNYYLKAFDTDEAIKENPVAISILVGLLVLALAIA